MREEVIKKYVKDLDGLLKQVRRWKKPSIVPPYHDTIVLMFGLLLNYLRFARAEVTACISLPFTHNINKISYLCNLTSIDTSAL
jgi:hypothetical protein